MNHDCCIYPVPFRDLIALFTYRWSPCPFDMPSRYCYTMHEDNQVNILTDMNYYSSIDSIAFLEFRLWFTCGYSHCPSHIWWHYFYIMSSSFYSLLSVSSVVAPYMVLHHTYAYKPLPILIVCFTYLVFIGHNGLCHMTCCYTSPELDALL